ncbi:GNAT family N-acetyltransferase [Rhizobium sp. 32-5/1]|uniref:GNAT family N-acetyltransferase n=1 Tax=Rhizobium sp. 32-5/1 TaxID=3019602 RepID=UPI00240E65E3|nr:GNAT family N-acetyltransferase [Rhizobium sp. 32-5/1]WEZ82138.1 GNAT family N-acetyltransferase [Rhizobium sp. 32-5/1]
MSGNLEIRPVQASDEQDWRRLWTAYLDFYETTLPEDIYTLTFSRLLSGDINEYAGLLAILDGRPVGLAHILFHRSCWHRNSICYLQDLFADPGIRGQGIGRALIEAVYARAKDAGSEEVYWMTQDFNATARKLYDRIADKTPFIIYQKTF